MHREGITHARTEQSLISRKADTAVNFHRTHIQQRPAVAIRIAKASFINSTVSVAMFGITMDTQYMDSLMKVENGLNDKWQTDSVNTEWTQLK